MCSGLFSTEKDIHKSTFSDELLDKWHKDGLTFMIQVFPRGRYITKAAQYVSLCPAPQQEKDRAQAPVKSAADEWGQVAKARLSTILKGNAFAWHVLGSHLAGLPSDVERELTLKTLSPAE